MTTLVTDTGFGPDGYNGGFSDWEDLIEGSPHPVGAAIDVPNTIRGDELGAYFDTAPMIRIPFPSSADGRGFSIARLLRLSGYTGKIRAKGHVLADQYAMARRCGFDEVEIDDDMATRQPEAQWQFRSNWQAHDYQSRLRQAV